MLRALLNRGGYHFTDFSPSGNVVELNRRLGFTDLDTSAVMWPNLPWPTIPGPGQSHGRTLRISNVSWTGIERQIYLDHRGRAAAARQVVMRNGDRRCLVVFRRDRRKDLPLFASVLYVSDREAFRRGAVRVQPVPAVSSPPSIGPARDPDRGTGPSARRPHPQTVVPRCSAATRLRPDQIDYLYSELTHVAW